MQRFNLLLVLAVLSFPVFANTETLVPHTATYKIKISIASGTLTTDVRRTADGFEANSVIEPTGLANILMGGNIEETSQFVVDDEGVKPMVYSSNDTLSRGDKFMDFAFDWQAREVSGTVNEETYSYPLDQEVHDRVSIQYQLMHNLVTGAVGEEYAMLDDDEMKQSSVRRIGNKTIKVPMGSFEAVGIQHQAAGSKRITTLWCAEELGYLPVLIEQSRKGKVNVRAQLTNYESFDTVAAAP